MMHRAWSSVVQVPFCFSRSYVKFQGNTALKIVEFDPNWAFPDCNSSLNSPMAMKCCTKLESAKERCPIVFQGHPSNFKVTRYKTSPILTQIGRFRTIGRSQLSNPSDLPCSFLLLKMREQNIGNEFSCGGLFHFLITVSLRGKGHMDWRAFSFSNYCLATRKKKLGSHECFFAFVNVLYEEHKKQTRQADTNPIYASP